MTHIEIFNGQMNQMEAGDAFPTSREEAMYIDGTEDGLNDGDIYYDQDNQVIGIHVGSAWKMIPVLAA